MSRFWEHHTKGSNMPKDIERKNILKQNVKFVSSLWKCTLWLNVGRFGKQQVLGLIPPPPPPFQTSLKTLNDSNFNKPIIKTVIRVSTMCLARRFSVWRFSQFEAHQNLGPHLLWKTWKKAILKKKLTL